jgi:hypothetical protein
MQWLMDRKVTCEALPTDPTEHRWEASGLHCLVPLNIRDTTRCECGIAIVVYDEHVGERHVLPIEIPRESRNRLRC